MYNTKKIITVLPILLVMFLGGCATSGQVFFSRPVIEKDIKSGFNTLALTADRRIAVFTSNEGKKISCAEALPDVAISSEVHSSVNVALKKLEDELSVEAAESIKQAISVAYQRTEKSDLVRQLGWQLCQGYLNGAITDEHYFYLLERLVLASLVKVDSDNGGSSNDLKNLFTPLKQ